VHSTLLFSSVLSRARRAESEARRKANGRVQGVLWLRARETLWEEEPGGEAGFSGPGYPGKHRAPSSFQTYCPRNLHLLVPLFLHIYQNSYGINQKYIYYFLIIYIYHVNGFTNVLFCQCKYLFFHFFFFSNWFKVGSLVLVLCTF
jgi:hypothetical protein